MVIVMNKKMQIGDTVKVIKDGLMSYKMIGTIIDFPKEYPNCAMIQFEHWNNQGEKTLYIKKENLERIDKIMDAVVGNYRIALVKFVQGINTTKKYAFALFDENVSVGDCVLCDTSQGYNVAKVEEIQSQIDYSETIVTKEVICKVDMKQYEQRKLNRQRKANLKKQMDKIVAANQNLVLYRAIAESNSEMKALLEELESLE